ELAGPEVTTLLSDEPSASLYTWGPPLAPEARLKEWLADQQVHLNTRLSITEPEAFGSLSLWLGLHAGRALAALSVAGPAADRWPCLFQFTGSEPSCNTMGLAGDGSLALLDRGVPRDAGPRRRNDEPRPFGLEITAYGPQAQEAASRLAGLVGAWDAAGRPS